MKAKKKLLCTESVLLLLAVIGKISFVLYIQGKDPFDYGYINARWHLTIVDPLLLFLGPLVLCQLVTKSWKIECRWYANAIGILCLCPVLLYFLLSLFLRNVLSPSLLRDRLSLLAYFYVDNLWIFVALGVACALSPFLSRKANQHMTHRRNQL